MPRLRDVIANFWKRVNKNGAIPEYRPELGPCWLWLGAPQKKGYGRIRIGGKLLTVHRYAYELLKAPIPHGLTLDHLCRVRLCVRPSHLEPVTSAVNTQRGVGITATNAAKTHCPKGHPYDGINHRVRGHERICLRCRQDYDYKRYHGRPREVDNLYN